MQYSLKAVANSKPKRYVVMLGSLPFSRPMSKHDAEQWLMVQNGELAEMTISWNGSQTRNIIKAGKEQ